MKLATFTRHGSTGLGKVLGNRLIDLAAALPGLPKDMISLLNAGDAALESVRQLPDSAGPQYLLSEVSLEAPVPNPSKILAIGMNYEDHAEEIRRKGVTVPSVQIWFNKQVSCVNPPNAPIHMPRTSKMLDYELELAVVIGQRCRHVSAANALSVIAGYTIMNDVSVRDVQWSSPTWTLGKSFDTHGPMGPWLVTADEIENPHELNMTLWVNDEIRQSGNSKSMIFNICQQIEHLSSVMTLMPGDVLVTGTPAGVGAASDPPRYLKPGDVVRLQIEGIGEITHTVVDEPR